MYCDHRKYMQYKAGFSLFMINYSSLAEYSKLIGSVCSNPWDYKVEPVPALNSHSLDGMLVHRKSPGEFCQVARYSLYTPGGREAL